MGFKRKSIINNNTSWQGVAKWYSRITKDGGHYYHQNLIIPESLRLLDLKEGSSLLDLGCGSGVLGQSIPKGTGYLGIDLSENLIREAKNEDRDKSHQYIISDAARPMKFTEKFTHAAMILSFQNMRTPQGAVKNAFNHLRENGKLLIVINHPMFRIPRQSSWGEDTAKKTQFRRIDKYMSTMEIPINTNPSDKKSPVTLSFHFPLWLISKMLKSEGFVIEAIEEWTSDKESVGRMGKMENRARSEFPLFMAILARKI